MQISSGTAFREDELTKGQAIDGTLSVVIPTLNAAATVSATLDSLATLGRHGRLIEIIVVDGGSHDETCALACDLGARVVMGPRGRGRQLAAGALAATGDVLLFLHADTRLDATACATLSAFGGGAQAGYFRFALDDDAPAARRLERWVARRCRWLGLPYGDQGLILTRRLYLEVGGFRPLPLMEDVDLVLRLGRTRLAALPGTALTSAERFKRRGYLRQSARNLCCLCLYLSGLSAERVAKLYG